MQRPLTGMTTAMTERCNTQSGVRMKRPSGMAITAGKRVTGGTKIMKPGNDVRNISATSIANITTAIATKRGG